MQEKHKKPLIVLTGPTAWERPHYPSDLAKAVGGEIISADSMRYTKGWYRNCQDYAGGNAGREALSGE